jgi:hypothetical protein
MKTTCLNVEGRRRVVGNGCDGRPADRHQKSRTRTRTRTEFRASPWAEPRLGENARATRHMVGFDDRQFKVIQAYSRLFKAIQGRKKLIMRAITAKKRHEGQKGRKRLSALGEHARAVVFSQPCCHEAEPRLGKRPQAGQESAALAETPLQPRACRTVPNNV